MSEETTRRDVMKRIGAGTAVAATGLAQSAAAESPEKLLEDEAVRTALSTADIDKTVLEFSEATTVTVDSDVWVEVPVDAGEETAFATDRNGRAEVKTGPNSAVRVDTTGDETTVEDLEMGQAVLEETLQLVDDREWTAMLDQAGIRAIDPEEADAHVDHTSGVRRVVAAAETTDGQTTSLLLEIGADGSIQRGFDFSKQDGVRKDGAIDCWTKCIKIGYLCTLTCKACIATPAKPTCIPCAVCVGGSAGSCAATCGIAEFW